MEESENCFSLKWRDFRSNLSEGFHDLLEEKTMVDVTLAAEGKFLQAHKLVLSVCSPYFKSLFEVNPCKHPIVILKDVGHSELSKMLQFMYKGEVGVRENDLPSFLKLADTLQVKGLSGENFKTDNDELPWRPGKISTKVKIKKNSDSIANKENSDCQLLKDNSTQKSDRKRRLASKLERKAVDYNKKMKVNDFVGSDNMNLSSDSESDECQSNGPLERLTSVNIKCENDCDFTRSFSDNKSLGNISTQSIVKSDNGDNNEKDNKDNFDEDNDLIGNQEDFYSCANPQNSDNVADSDKTPQGHLGSLVISRAPRAFVWDYFLKETHQAICLNCGKTFKGQRPNTICEQHLKRVHPEFYKILVEKKIKRAELHMNPMVMGLGIPSYDHD